MPRIELYDTTLRDGSQGEGINFSLQDKLQIARKLDALGFDYVEGGYPLSNPKDEAFFQEAAGGQWASAKIAAFGMTRRKEIDPADDVGLQALVASKAPVVTIVGKTWDLHVTEVLRVSLEENLAMIADSVRFIAEGGQEVVYDAEHFFDGYAANPEYAMQTLLAAQNAGAKIAILCDTNGGTLPNEIRERVTAAREGLTIPVGIHCHNDSDVAIANSLAAVEAGAVQVQGTINGIGERCGNADLISVAANLSLKMGYDVLGGDGMQKLTELSRYVYELANKNFRNGQPFVGNSAFAHKGGMHVHAVNRLARSYEHIEPEAVGNTRRILVSELSGRSNIVAKTTKYRIENDSALMTRILNRVQDLENEGYQFEAAEASFDLLVKKESGTYTPIFRRIRYRTSSETDPEGGVLTEATVKLQIDAEDGVHIRHRVAEGDGPVNALDSAMRLALEDLFPNLTTMHLVDYKVRVINSAEGTAARVRVVIESRDDSEVWSTIGVHENIIEASYLALVDSMEYKLFKDRGEV